MSEAQAQDAFAPASEALRVVFRQRIAELEAEKQHVQTMLDSFEKLLLEASNVVKISLPAHAPAASPVNQEATPSWKSIEAAVKKLGGKNTINQIFEELQQMKVNIRRDSIRTAMMRRPETFYRVSDGIYDLVANREADTA